MKNDSLSILKTFTRKLANCRYRVAPTKLIEDLKNGGFGYTVEEGEPEVVNNDFVLADDFATLLDSIRVIFREPRLHLKKENIVKHAESASKYDTATLKATYKDEKLWRIKNGEPSPEYVHTFVYEDDMAIYENRFVCFVIDEILEEVSKKINELALSVETVNRKMGGEGESLFTTHEYVDFMGEELPVLITDDSATVKVLRSLIKTKKWLYSLKSKPLYKNCQKEGVFNPLGLKPTNILTKDINYYNCYNFYLNYLNKDPSFQTEEGMYLGYVTVNLLGALDKLGFTLTEDNEKIGITNSAVIRFGKINLEKGVFSVTLTQEDGAVMMTVKTTDGNKAKYLFKALCSDGASKIEGFDNLTAYVNGLPARDDVVKTFIVNDLEEIPEFNAVYVEPTLASSVDIFVKAVKSCFLLGVGSSFMHARYCPVCGSNLVTLDDEDYVCADCGTKYHVFEHQENDMIWFKDVPKSYQYISRNELRPEIDEAALTALDAEPIIRKTFMQKLSSSEEQVQNYYNQIKHTLLGYKKVKSKVSRSYDRFNIGRNSIARIGLRGKTLVLYLALNVEDYLGTKYRPKDMSEKKRYADTPMMVKVKSDRGLKYALELIDVMLDGIPKKEPTELVDYVEHEIPAELLEGAYVKKSFIGKLCQTDAEVQSYYSAVKNVLLSYKKVNSRVSFSCDTFNRGRQVLAKFGVRGKTLVLYLALNPNEYANTKYYPKNVGDVKKYADTPMMVKVKSERGAKFAIELVEKMLDGTKKKNDFVEVKYFEPYMNDAKLLNKGLAKIVKLSSMFN